ncbi:tRNA pseudouridine(38-40) synthase TruA [Tepidimicrobium xylanilyticum]|uniref:tRNA pseudouridine synthase A n=1 Tax=Tepidimicrobium xylanilyticum TaxID=1123352 RepID=A0A1H2VJC7_9FIRM|nr:tRNA pseudouridine(38-40) synthase TruA [Tepidimicrobium xylanilyticum]GMG97853.1 tRNA pseudouridine synthase A [Tepidimicrobium xylanilyticum]SDW68330.1 tRNA pseudouridine38-40 synthase [Tepidimicrobium xylanilyticum]
MINIKLTIQYEGTNYCGWQKQKNGNSIQKEIERAIKEVTGENVNLIGSGRTDKGVHAIGQVANFLTNTSIPPDRIKFALNNILPEDIRIIESEEVNINFHSRYDAIGKRYKYVIYSSQIGNPLYRNFAYHVPFAFDIEEMKKAMKFFIGTHDFSAFMASNSGAKSTIRTIDKFFLEKKDDLMVFTIEGNGFLYNMVRIIIGTLVDVGRKRFKSDEIPHIIKSKNRRFAGHTAPPEGLYLVKVFY